MPEITVTLVDHTQGTSAAFKGEIMHHLGNVLMDLLDTPSEIPVVNLRWLSSSPAPDDQDLVIHFVQDADSSYLVAKMPGTVLGQNIAGHTNRGADRTGTEFYRRPVINGRPTKFSAEGLAKVAAHEAMHNITGLGNNGMHHLGGLAHSPPQPVTQANRDLVQASLPNIRDQLL